MALPSSRTVIIAGAGIGGLTAALALARSGFRALVLEQAERLEETGAGIQLSPNAMRILIGLGLADSLRPHVVAPEAIRVLGGRSGREIVRIPLGGEATQRYGAPYWVIHRGDLQAALSEAAVQDLNIVLRLGMSMEDFATHPHGVTVSARGTTGLWTEHGHALIAADGLWSAARARIASKAPPRFAGRTAWRALVPAAQLAPEFRDPLVYLWLGRDAHLVHYPVKGGKLINVVVITADDWSGPGWSEPASRIDLLARLSSRRWAPQAHSVFRAPDAWLKWALYESEPLTSFAQGAAALLGDAAHAMLPFLAQGAAMAIEDGAVAAQCLARMPDDPAAAWESYSAIRRGRTRKVQRLAARNGKRYHRAGAAAMLRNTAMRLLGGERLLQNYDWLYDWRPPAGLSIT
ncbi:MAG TPA: FAD-dependent monooxygenase [Xanthobacteraceae bacterium]|nr:FAD-dependent monooxygenase [Xanthobacteraceae bacterium]